MGRVRTELSPSCMLGPRVHPCLFRGVGLEGNGGLASLWRSAAYLLRGNDSGVTDALRVESARLISQ